MNPVQFYKCLADDTRLRCLLLIALEGELCVCELMAALEQSQPKISRHLAQLRRCALVQDRRQGQWVFYSLEPRLAPWCNEVLQQTAMANRGFLRADLQRLNRMGERPSRAQACC
ncbi:MAG: metalloregulator ArsR/SmtB family transcription factor [Pseudomonadota bacterium]|nr:metalloregulator ArsR/SmtB family transcription factor [Pseudomonadota bacterium]